MSLVKHSRTTVAKPTRNILKTRKKNKKRNTTAELTAILCRTSTKNSYAMHTIKNTPNLLFQYQFTSRKFIRLPNRIKSKLFCPNWNALAHSTRALSRRPRANKLLTLNVITWPPLATRTCSVAVHVQSGRKHASVTLRTNMKPWLLIVSFTVRISDVY